MGIIFRKTSRKIGNEIELKPRQPCLNEAQKSVIRNNWHNLKCHLANIGVVTYVGLFESRPELMEVFSKFKGRDLYELRETGLLTQHALRVMATFDQVIACLDTPSLMNSLLREVGAKHQVYKVPPDNMEIILPHFLNAIKPYIEDHWCDELEEAWKTLFAVIVYNMKEGMKRSERR